MPKSVQYLSDGLAWFRRQIARRRKEIASLNGRPSSRAVRARIRKLTGQIRRRQKQADQLRARLHGTR